MKASFHSFDVKIDGSRVFHFVAFLAVTEKESFIFLLFSIQFSSIISFCRRKRRAFIIGVFILWFYTCWPAAPVSGQLCVLLFRSSSTLVLINFFFLQKKSVLNVRVRRE
jgi:hypothetical protein